MVELEPVDAVEVSLVVVSGCSHAGAVKLLRNARRLTGRGRIVGFVGGFHPTVLRF
jgi:metal-dependent hydrolase (beta-lactamase superfamily II)